MGSTTTHNCDVCGRSVAQKTELTEIRFYRNAIGPAKEVCATCAEKFYGLTQTFISCCGKVDDAPTDALGPAVLQESVLKEYTPIGGYRVRLMRMEGEEDNGLEVLDIREYVSSPSFEGFTRRGIRVALRPDLEALRDVLLEVIERYDLEHHSVKCEGCLKKFPDGQTSNHEVPGKGEMELCVPCEKDLASAIEDWYLSASKK